MGNASGKAKQKPLILRSVPSDKRVFKVSFLNGADREEIKLEESSTPNAYYLPWASSDYTEGEINLSAKHIKYFFTADMSGCSLWCRFDSGKLKIRHEARTDKESRWLHESSGFQCVVDSSANEDDVRLEIDGMNKIAQFYVVYALLDHKERVLEFRSQLVRLEANLETRAERFELVKVDSIPVPFPGS